MINRPIIALDFDSKESVQMFLSSFPKDESLYVKIGMELYYQLGSDIVKYLTHIGHDVFLDLKLCDIPNTVHKAMKVLSNLGIAMTNVHASGGSEMMRAAKAGLEEGGSSQTKRPLLIAVTQLTSTSEEMMHTEQLIPVPLVESVCHYAALTSNSGLDGVVCSAHEVQQIKKVTSNDFICLTPGIRPLTSEVGDQKRVMTPRQAYDIGSDYIVVGRPITQSETPYESYTKILNEWNGIK